VFRASSAATPRATSATPRARTGAAWLQTVGWAGDRLTGSRRFRSSAPHLRQ
jgi:hypothetical protein